MVLIDAEIVKPCPKGANAALIVEGNKQRVLTSLGEVYKPVFYSEYVAGFPFQEVVRNIPAPIDLMRGDVLRVEGDDFIPWAVVRNGETVWVNKPAEAQEAANTAERLAARAAIEEINKKNAPARRV